MEMTAADIRHFKKLYLKYFGMELDDMTARRKLTLLVRQMELVYQPITKAQVKALDEKDGYGNGKLLPRK